MEDNLNELKTKALEIAQRYIDYGSYGETESKAIAALRKRCPGHNKEDYTEWFKKAELTHKNAIAFVKTHQDKAYELYKENKKEKNIGLEPLANDFSKSNNDFNTAMLLNTICFVFYLYHLR